MNNLSIEEQRARDAIAFDGFPPSKYVTICDNYIKIRVNYSEKLSATIRSIGGGKWHNDKAEWRFPFTAWRAVAAHVDAINRLAAEASQCRQTETSARSAERRSRDEERQREANQKSEANAMNAPRRIKREYVEAAKSQPLFNLELESIGDPKALGLDFLLTGIKSRNYVGQVMAYDGSRFVMAYLRGNRDYARSNSRGSRGIFVSYLLSSGPIYKVASPLSWGSTDRYFCRIENGSIIRMTEEEVLECLEK